MIDIAPTVAVSGGASVPLAALGRDTFEPGTGMEEISAGARAGFDLGVLLAGIVLPHVSFERAWASCERGSVECRAKNDVAALSVRVTSRGTFRVFGELGVGLRRLTTDPALHRVNSLAAYDTLGFTENRRQISDDNLDIRWSGIDAIRLAVGSAYALRDDLAIEAKLDCAIGSFRHVETGTQVITNLDPNTSPLGFSADLRSDARQAYVIFGLTVAIRGFLPIR